MSPSVCDGCQGDRVLLKAEQVAHSSVMQTLTLILFTAGFCTTLIN